MVRFEGHVMTEVKYSEVMQEREAKEKVFSPMGSVNKYFFGKAKVSLSESLYFYGTLGGMAAASLICLIVKVIN